MTKPLWESSFLANTLAAFIPLILFFLYLATWMRKDYKAFLDLGPGATPQIPLGWCRLKMLGLFRLKSFFTPPCISTTMSPATGILSSLLNGVDLVQSSLALHPSGRWIKERRLKPLNTLDPA
jgi:hypothetical protein